MERKRNKITWDTGRADPLGDIKRGKRLMERRYKEKACLIPIGGNGNEKSQE